MNKLYSFKKFCHHFYCLHHDDGYIIITESPITPEADYNFCSCNPEVNELCFFEYHGLNGKDEKWYDDANGGFKKKYFRNNIIRQE